MHDPWSIVTAPGAVYPHQSRSAPCSPMKPTPPVVRTRPDSFHTAHKVPLGDTPYVKAKRVQLVDKDPEKAIALFWAAINAGDRVDSALKDMAIVMKQQNRPEEAIEAIKSLRHRCSDTAQESLDNILLDLYKRCGRLEDQITLLKMKLFQIQKGLAFNGKRTKTARSQGRKFQVSVDQEATRLLGNLGWALMQIENYVEAEAAYRRALLMGPDNNKMCNLGICLMKQGRMVEAKETLRQVKPAMVDALRGADSHFKAFERAQEMLRDLESKLVMGTGTDRGRGNTSSSIFDSFIWSSSIWQPQPCIDYKPKPKQKQKEKEKFGDENQEIGGRRNNAASAAAATALNIDAQPFYGNKHLQEKLKRTRSGTPTEKKEGEGRGGGGGGRGIELLLPDDDAFEAAIVAAVLAPVLEDDDVVEPSSGGGSGGSNACGRKVGKKQRLFDDITLALNNSVAWS